MRIGNRRIAGFGRRFWILLAVVALGIVAIISLQPGPPVVTDPYVTPAFPVTELALGGQRHIEDAISYYGHPHYATSIDDFTTNYADEVGWPLRFHVYIPTAPSVSSDPQLSQLQVTKDGYSCTVGAYLDPTKVYSDTALQSIVQAGTGDLVQLCFPSADVPTGGAAYVLTGLLWWRSDLFDPTPAAAAAANGQPAPAAATVLISGSPGPQALSADELRAPTTHVVNLNLFYQEGPLELAVHRIEWSAGNELRACVTVQNTSSGTVGMWTGTSATTADVGSGLVPVGLDPNSALGASSLVANQAVSGFLVFGSAASDPTQQLTLRMPALNQSLNAQGASTDTITIKVPQQYIQSEAQSSGNEDSSCDVASESTGISSLSGSSSAGAASSGAQSPETQAYPGQAVANANQ